MRAAHANLEADSRLFPTAHAADSGAGAVQDAPHPVDSRHPRRVLTDKIILVSSNPNKAIEAERILGMPLLRVSLSLPEIQAATVEEITRYKLEAARSKGY